MADFDPNRALSSTEVKGLLTSLGIPQNGTAMAHAVELDMAARGGNKTGMKDAARELASLFMQSGAQNGPLAGLSRGKAMEAILKAYVRLHKSLVAADAGGQPDTPRRDDRAPSPPPPERGVEKPAAPTKHGIKIPAKAVKRVAISIMMKDTEAAQEDAKKIAKALCKSEYDLHGDAVCDDLMTLAKEQLAEAEEENTSSESDLGADAPERQTSEDAEAVTSGNFKDYVLNDFSLLSWQTNFEDVARLLRTMGKNAAKTHANRVLIACRREGVVRDDTPLNVFLAHCATLELAEDPIPGEGNGFDAYILDRGGFKKFSDAFVQLADIAEEKGQGPALRHAAKMLDVLVKDKEVLREDTPAQALLDFCMAHRTDRPARDEVESVDDHTPAPIDLSDQDPRLPPAFLEGHLKYKKMMSAMQKEVDGEQRWDVLIKLANAVKTFAQKEMKREGLPGGSQIDPEAIIEHWFGTSGLGPAPARVDSEAIARQPSGLKLSQRDVNQTDWNNVLAKYSMSEDFSDDMKSIASDIVRKGADNASVEQSAKELLAKSKKAKTGMFKNFRHIVAAAKDAVMRRAKNKKVTKALKSAEIDEVLSVASTA